MRPVLRPQIKEQQEIQEQEIELEDVGIDLGNRKTEGARFSDTMQV